MADHEGPALFQRLGGDVGVTAVVDHLYQRILADPELAPFFAGIDVDAVRSHQHALVMAAVGGPTAYEGRDLREAHEDLAITPVHVRRVCDHLAAALEAEAAAPSDVRVVVDLIARLWSGATWP